MMLDKLASRSTGYSMRLALIALTALCVVALAPRPTLADDAQKLVEDSANMAKSLLADPEWRDFADYFKTAKAVVLVPDFLKAGFFIGGAGGQCVMVARAPGGGWTAPSFCLMGEASLGLQIGAQKAEILMMVMTDGALERLVGGNAKLGGEAGITVGLVGANVKGDTTLNLGRDIYAFGRSQGLFGGLALEGGWIGPDSDYNHSYYGRAVTAHDILVTRRVTAPAAKNLIDVLIEADNVKSVSSR